ncbi:spermatogenesis associated 2-like [Xiphias gladius]|uniref:spermatogenesis associated 2-like n=1 Tax=Xiphias gladius TaxID=8245 RepID=UPI001A99DA10|nr:spermatogenesis associated 2-like [Xiphias gladius]XP_039989107.1 spermatogenesis associated 2-like [Xiphias gladius]XP_039989108.1 spermatogenesis associated 2-like [Xiphias gladius]
MSNSSQRARDLLTAYNHSLDQQIVGRGSNLACRDEELWKQVERQLREGDAQVTHCLGLDPLKVMEESLKATSTTPASGGQVKARGGLQGLAKAFEVLEQAALNLYLGPWRDEYKVVKMYSGTFTHYIKPVLSMPQIEKLFGLLGYQPSSSRHEQLFLQALRISPASLEDLLRMSCAFYLARCECRLLEMALGKHVGDAQWELSVVRERQRGNSLQVTLDNTKKTLKVNQPLMEPFDGELDVDLYTDEHVNEGGAVVNDDGSPRSLTWLTKQSASPLAVKTESNGMTSLSPSSTSLPTTSCIYAPCQLAKMSPPESDSARSSSASKRQGRHPCEESKFDKADVQSHSDSLQLEAMGLCKSEAEANHFCSCLQSPHLYLNRCIECKTWHNITCAMLKHCFMEDHSVVTSYITAEEMNESGAVSPQSESLRVSDMSASQTLTSSSAAMSSLVLCDDPKFLIQSLHPITFHDCCNLAQLDPQVLCRSCGVFHSCSCRDIDYCQIHHTIKQLGVCACGKACSRKPLVLCRYCGNEYCRDCWYRSPVVCTCGQTFDQSSSV